jgi:hypothetical protein
LFFSYNIFFPQIYSAVEAIQMLLQISKRCFTKVIVAAVFDAENPKLTETEKLYLIGLLQLMESAYKTDIWDNLGVVTFQSKGGMKPNQTNLTKKTLPNLT